MPRADKRKFVGKLIINCNEYGKIKEHQRPLRGDRLRECSHYIT